MIDFFSPLKSSLFPTTKIEGRKLSPVPTKRGKKNEKCARVLRAEEATVKDKKRIIKAEERVENYFILAFLALDHSRVVRVVS
jgi:hypothetical protein